MGGGLTDRKAPCMRHDAMAESSHVSAISACEKASAWKLALGLLPQKQADEVSPTINNYNAAISACEVASEWKS